jgi:hypothetical protein
VYLDHHHDVSLQSRTFLDDSTVGQVVLVDRFHVLLVVLHGVRDGLWDELATVTFSLESGKVHL